MAPYCQSLARHAPITLAVTKTTVARWLETHAADDDDLVRRAYGSSGFHDGAAAFLAKHSPLWSGQ